MTHIEREQIHVPEYRTPETCADHVQPNTGSNFYPDRPRVLSLTKFPDAIERLGKPLFARVAAVELQG